MSTPYSNLYNSFLGKITDFTFANMTDAQLQATSLNYLRTAVVNFKGCRNSLTMDDTNSQFTADLTLEEQEILSTFMVKSWIDSMIRSTMLLKQALTDKDFQMTSQANHLKAMLSLQQSTLTECKQLVRAYTYDDTQGISELAYTETYDPITDYGVGANGNGVVGGRGSNGEQV